MFYFQHLNNRVRKQMLMCIDSASQTNDIYFSKQFSALGIEKWIPLLREAATAHNEHWLAFQIENHGLLKGYETARKPTGGYTTKHIPSDAAITLAEVQFNRFYMLGLCQCAKELGLTELMVCRARESNEHRQSPNALLGHFFSLIEVEGQLAPVEASLKSPLLKSESGLSLRLPLL